MDMLPGLPISTTESLHKLIMSKQLRWAMVDATHLSPGRSSVQPANQRQWSARDGPKLWIWPRQGDTPATAAKLVRAIRLHSHRDACSTLAVLGRAPSDSSFSLLYCRSAGRPMRLALLTAQAPGAPQRPLVKPKWEWEVPNLLCSRGLAWAWAWAGSGWGC